MGLLGQNKKASLTFIFITVMIDMIGIGLIVPVSPPLVMDLTGLDESGASQYHGWLMASFAIMQFIFAPILGALSDRYGRRPILLISLFGLGVDFIIHGMAPNLTWLFIGRILAGTFSATHSVAGAYVADVSSPEDRAKNYGMIGAAFGLGFIIGPVIGGVFAEQWGIRAPFYVAAGLSLLNFLYGYMVLPESLHKEDRRTFEWKNANPWGTLKHLKKYPVIVGLLVSFFILNMAGWVLPATWVLFSKLQFGWNEQMVGISLGVVGVTVAIVQGGLVGRIVKAVGEVNTIILGFVFWTIGMFLFGTATQGWMLFAFTAIYCIGGIAQPTLQGIISNQAPNNEQGEIQGGMASLVSLASIISPLMMTAIFQYFTSDDTPYHVPGAAFFLASGMIVVALLLALPTLRKLKNQPKPEPQPEPSNAVEDESVLDTPDVMEP